MGLAQVADSWTIRRGAGNTGSTAAVSAGGTSGEPSVPPPVDDDSKRMAFFAELKRRRVGKVAIGYGAVAWMVTEASSVVLPALRLPEWTVTFVVVFLMAGFPIAMIMAWVFDVGPQGIRRTAPLRDETEDMRLRLRVAYAAVVVLLMTGLGYLLYERGLGRALAGEQHGSIAVLPFTNLSGDASKDYFSDGMSEELLNLLARVPGLQVASRTSAFAYKGRNVDIRQVGRELGVETVLEGSVRQAGDQVRITAQLIDTETGFHLWSDTYERQLADIFQVQDEIAGAIVDRLRIQLAPQEQQLAQRTHAPTQNVEAYELYLQGRAVWKKRGEANLKRAIELYQAALGHDPAFARAHAALASSYVVMAGYTKEQGDEKRFNPLAEGEARQALVLDPNIGEAHAVLAQLNSDRGDYLDAESGFFFGISLEPNEPTPHHWYSILLAKVGRLQAALTQARRAYELDPASPVLAANLANVLLQLGQNDEALRFVDLASELGLSEKEYGVEATVAMRRGDWANARRLIVKIPSIPDEIKPEAARFVDALADPKLRPAVVADMRAVDPKVAPQISFIGPYLQLGEVDLAYRILDEELRKDPHAWAADWDLGHAWTPEGRRFRTDRRFGALTQRIGMMDYWKQYGYPDACRAGSADIELICS
jgi:TolB-like protein/tetratricopeptide (TPR) repeat protein